MIIQIPSPVLRKIAAPVGAEAILSLKTRRVIAKMREALAKCEDGVALAAPQIGVSMRIFILSEKHFPEAPGVYINPVIVRKSARKILIEEGCLSARGLHGKMKRMEKVTVVATDEKGKKFSRGASGLLAQVFQHETDHLDGVLFLDNATVLNEIPQA